MMAKVESNGSPFCIPNIDLKIFHALVKLTARKNTQVIFTKKKVNSAKFGSISFKVKN